MKKDLRTKFITRQFMMSRDFELYYYNEERIAKLESHSHNYYEFYFFLEGNVSMKIEGSKYPLKYGDVVLIPPGVEHQALIHDNERPYRRFVLWISKEYLNQLLNISECYGYFINQVITTKKYIMSNDIIKFNSIQSKVFQLIGEINSERYGREAKITIGINDIILYLNRIAFEKNNPKNLMEETSLYENVRAFIEENLEEALSLERIAKEFFVSKYHIAHVFKENIGISIHQYITKRRLESCRDAILAETSIGNAYLMFGFRDYSCFYRAFKKEYGMSPKEFQKKQREKTHKLV